MLPAARRGVVAAVRRLPLGARGFASADHSPTAAPRQQQPQQQPPQQQQPFSRGPYGRPPHQHQQRWTPRLDMGQQVAAILEEMQTSTAPAVPEWLGTSDRLVRLAEPRSERALQAELAKLRWPTDPVQTLGRENREEVYLARLVATSIWRNRSLPTAEKRAVIQSVIDSLTQLIAVKTGKAPPPGPPPGPAFTFPKEKVAKAGAPAKGGKPAAKPATKPATADKKAAAPASGAAAADKKAPAATPAKKDAKK